MEVTATTRNARMSAFKGRPLCSACQGLKAADALKVVEFSPKKAAVIIRKTILSAVANARHNNHVEDAAGLWVKLCVLDESVRMRRYWPTARGSAHPIARRMCHCKVVLTDEPIPSRSEALKARKARKAARSRKPAAAAEAKKEAK